MGDPEEMKVTPDPNETRPIKMSKRMEVQMKLSARHIHHRSWFWLIFLTIIFCIALVAPTSAAPRLGVSPNSPPELASHIGASPTPNPDSATTEEEFEDSLRYYYFFDSIGKKRIQQWRLMDQKRCYRDIGVVRFELHGKPYWMVLQWIFEPPCPYPDGLKMAFYTLNEAGSWELVVSTFYSIIVDSMEQVFVDPDNIWLSLTSSGGFTPSSTELLRFDGQHITTAFEGKNISFKDIDGDGFQELLSDTWHLIWVNWSQVDSTWVDYWKIYDWDGKAFHEIKLQYLPETAPEPLRTLNNRAVVLARAELWKDAEEFIQKALTAAGSSPNEIVQWNAHLITQFATNRRAGCEGAKKYNPFTYDRILRCMVYGDYVDAVEGFRHYRIDAIFAYPEEEPTYSAVMEDVYEWADVPRSVIDYTNKGLAVLGDSEKAREQRAAGLFLQAWAYYLRNVWHRNTLYLTEQAYKLAPEDPLYGQAYGYLYLFHYAR
jgi:hypothetical protein